MKRTDDGIADTIAGCLISPNCCDSNLEPANVVDGLYQIAQSIRYLADHLGMNKAATNFGAIEAHSLSVEKVADAINNLAAATERQ